MNNNNAIKSENERLWPDKRAKQKTNSLMPLHEYTGGIMSAIAGYYRSNRPVKRSTRRPVRSTLYERG